MSATQIQSPLPTAKLEMAPSTQANVGRLSTEGPILQRKAADADAEPSEPDSDNSTQHPTFSYGSEASSRSSLSALSRIAKQIKPKLHTKEDRQLLERFEVPFDQKIHDRFKVVHNCIEGPLLMVLFNSGTRQCSMSIRLMALGPSRAEAEPYIVVFASQDQRKRIQKFFKRPTVQTIYNPPDLTLPRFKIYVHGSSPEKKSGEGGIEVLAPLEKSQIQPVLSISDCSTYCGTPITVRHPSGYEVRATLGGILEVVDESGGLKLYGLTAGHVMDDDDGETSLPSINLGDGRLDMVWTDSDSGSSSDTETDCSSSVSINADLLASPKNVKQLPNQGSHADPWSLLALRRLGIMKKHCEMKSHGGKILPKDGTNVNLDWALIEMESYAPNRYPTNPNASGAEDRLDHEHSGKDLQAPCVDEHEGHSLRALMISGSDGPKAGSISALPSRLLLGPGTGFVDARIIHLDGGKEVSNGDSGSWVVDEKTLEVYGHVVASDAFGGGYIISIKDTMKDIQRRLKAASVSLPTTDSFRNIAGVPMAIRPMNTPESTPGEIQLDTPSTIVPKDTEEPAVPFAAFSPFVPLTSSESHLHGSERPKGKPRRFRRRRRNSSESSESSEDDSDASQTSGAKSSAPTCYSPTTSYTSSASSSAAPGRHSNQWLFGDANVISLFRRRDKKT